MATEAVRSTVDVPVAFTIITGIARRCGRSGSPGISQGSVKRVSGVSWSAGELLCQWPGGQAASRSDGGLGQTGLGVLLPPASIASVIVTPVCAMAQPSTQVAGLGGSTSVSSSQPSQYLTPALNSQGPWTPSCPVSQGANFLVPIHQFSPRIWYKWSMSVAGCGAISCKTGGQSALRSLCGDERVIGR